MSRRGKTDASITSLSLISPPRRPSIRAAAARVSSTKVHRGAGALKPKAWQQEAYSLYDQVGELRYVAQTVGNGVGTATFGLTRDEDSSPIRLDEMDALNPTDRIAEELLADVLGDRIAAELAVGVFIAGEAMLIGHPDPDDPTMQRWGAYSPVECRERAGKIVIGGVEYNPDDLTIIRIWRPHPADSTQADSPVRSSLPVLRELVALTMHISASVDSRLAGAGVLVLPQSATVVGQPNPEDQGDDDPFLTALMDAMLTPIRDRDSAAGVVPLLMTVPDDAGFQPTHLTFATPLDANAKELRDESIRRLALGLDVPPEVLLGLSDSSHWNAWAIQEEAVRLHIGPLANLIARAVTDEYLRPSLIASGVPADVAHTYQVEVDLAKLLQRPNRHAEALELYDRGEISGDALREASGFTPAEAPQELSDATIRALAMVRQHPELLAAPGLGELIRQLDDALAGRDPGPAVEVAPEGGGTPTEAPEVTGEPGPPEAPDGA